MGWASAGPEIFDPVARVLIDHVTDPAIRQKVASGLIATLQAGDWDTEDESLDEFAHDLAIVAAFAEHGILREDEDGAPLPPPMPVFTIKAKDALALSAVAAYRNLCTEYGLHGQASEVQLAYNEIELWQQDHEEQVRLPDHKHVPVVGA